MPLFKLEEHTPEIERAYRQNNLQADIYQVGIGAAVWIIPYIGFTYLEYLLFGSTPLLFLVMALRAGYAVVSLVLLLHLSRYIHRYEMFDLLVLVWALVSVLLNIVINTLRPVENLAGFICDLVQIFSYYVFIPSRVLNRTLPSMLLAGYDLWLIFFIHPIGTIIDRQAFLFSFLLTNIIGIVFSFYASQSSRRAFIARRKEETALTELKRLASTDPLTGVLNRRRLLELAGEEFYRFRRYGRPFSVLLMDMDGFKRVNDTFGHQHGDNVLIQFAQRLSAEKRDSDAVGRMGGDEFCIVLPETSRPAASHMAERILITCGTMMNTGGALDVPVTVSIGIAQVQAEDTSLDAVFARADVALYRAKNEGRNRVEIM